MEHTGSRQCVCFEAGEKRMGLVVGGRRGQALFAFGIFTGGLVLLGGLYLHLNFKDAKPFTLTQDFYIAEKSVDMTCNCVGIILISVSSVFLFCILLETVVTAVLAGKLRGGE